jgi:hypothetical protein
VAELVEQVRQELPGDLVGGHVGRQRLGVLAHPAQRGAGGGEVGPLGGEHGIMVGGRGPVGCFGGHAETLPETEVDEGRSRQPTVTEAGDLTTGI